MRATPPAGVAARAGLITGLFVGILSLPFISLARFAGGRGLGLFFLLIALIAYAVAGFIATRRSGLLRSGVGAGALAAVITVFIAICLGIAILGLMAPRLMMALSGDPVISGRPHLPAARGLLRRGALLWLAALYGLIMLAVGAFGGFIGGLLGRVGRPQSPAAFPYAAAPTPSGVAAPYTPGGQAAGTQSYDAAPGPAPYFPPPIYHPDAPAPEAPTTVDEAQPPA
ncbi:MAG TPA: hypothetical protein VF808_05840 [Ktedonobacterales bacterium]